MKKNFIQSSLIESQNNLLNNVLNYSPRINNTIQEIINKFSVVMIEYMRLISEKINTKNKEYFKFIFERGIETLIHIFTIIFYNTKNLELTYYHTQKAYFFYIEFIEQITDDSVTFLQLSSRDAILFVYKKTIYELNNEYRINIEELNSNENNILLLFNTYTNIYKNIIHFIINNNNFKYETKMDYINLSCDSITIINDNFNKIKIKYINYLYLFTNILTDKKMSVEVFFNLLDEFIKKLNNKKKIDDKLIMKKFNDLEIINLINNDKFNNIIDLIFI